MVAKDVGQVVDMYDKVLTDYGHIPIRHENPKEDTSRGEHALWMCKQLKQMLDEPCEGLDNCLKKLGKIHRWLGFLQGMMQAIGIYSIEEMREHNRKDSNVNCDI